MDIPSLLDDFEAGVSRLTEVLREIPETAYDFMPVKADDWSIRQHVIHVADCETNNFIRIKSCIAQPYSEVYVIRELDWTKNLENRHENIQDYLALFALERRILTAFLKTVPEGDFDSKYFIRDYEHEVKKISLAEAVKMYADHIQFHIEYINRIYSEFLEQDKTLNR
jgi:hypothetical protein